MRISALEVEILVSTVSRLEKRRYRRTLAANAKAFDESIADIIQSSNRLSAEARVKASASVDGCGEERSQKTQFVAECSIRQR